MYNKLQSSIKAVIAKYLKQLILISDGWSNPRGKSIINYLLITRTEAIFLKLVATGKGRYTSKYIADGLNKVITKIGPKDIIAVMTDNVSNIKSS